MQIAQCQINLKSNSIPELRCFDQHEFIDFFFVPHSCHVDHSTIHVSLLSSKFTIFIHLSLVMMTWSVLILAYELIYNWPCSPWVLVAQWIGHSLSVRDSIPVGNSDFFFVPRSRHVDKFTFHNSLGSSKFTIFIHLLIQYLFYLFCHFFILSPWIFCLLKFLLGSFALYGHTMIAMQSL